MLIHYFDYKTKLYVKDDFIGKNVTTIPANATKIKPIYFHTPKWDGSKWIEAGDPVVIAALKKEALFSSNNQKTLERIAALEAQQTSRLLRCAALSDTYSVNKLKSLETQIAALRKTLV